MSSSDKKILADIIKKTRNDLGKSQEEFGKLFNPPAAKSIISRWEKGVSVPSKNRLEKISNLSGIPIHLLKNTNLYYSILNLVKFSLGYNSDEYEDDLKNIKEMSLEDRKFIESANKINSYSSFDLFIQPPDFSYINSLNDEKRNRVLNEYNTNEYNKKISYYTQKAFIKADLMGLNAQDRNPLIFLIENIVEDHFNEIKLDSVGIINLVNQKILSIMEKDIMERIYTTNHKSGKVYRESSIEESVEHSLLNILEETSNKLVELKNDTKKLQEHKD